VESTFLWRKKRRGVRKKATVTKRSFTGTKSTPMMFKAIAMTNRVSMPRTTFDATGDAVR
jgi:hypothetical protein